MNTMSKETQELIRELASKLPVIRVQSHEIRKITGAEILSWDTITEVKGEPVNPTRIYDWNYPVIQNANHYRRIKRAFKKDGIDGMAAYVDQVMALAKAKKVTGLVKAAAKIIEITKNS